jgi:hypothetical protein
MTCPARGSEEALAHLRRLPFDVMLTDINHPGLPEQAVQIGAVGRHRGVGGGKEDSLYREGLAPSLTFTRHSVLLAAI